MRSEYAANLALQAPASRYFRQTPERVTLPPSRRTLWGLIFFWL